MIYAPLFGYFGDRFKRKPIMLIGIAIWVSAAAATTFVPAPEGHSKQVSTLSSFIYQFSFCGCSFYFAQSLVLVKRLLVQLRQQ